MNSVHISNTPIVMMHMANMANTADTIIPHAPHQHDEASTSQLRDSKGIHYEYIIILENFLWIR